MNWLQDLYPEIAAAFGVRLARGPIGAMITALRDASLRTAALNVTISDEMAAKVRALARQTPIVVIQNWQDDQHIRPIARSANPLVHTWKLQNRFVVGYSGNLGRGHDWLTIVAAAELLKHNRSIVFLIIGGGAGLVRLKEEVVRRKLEASFIFKAYQAWDQLPYSLSAPNVHLVSQSPAFNGLMFPSKVYGIAAAGRPLIAITQQQTDLAKLIREHQCGAVVSPGDAPAVANVFVE